MLVVAGACGGNGDSGNAASGTRDTAPIDLTAPRVADDEGVATAVSVEAIELDGARRHPVSPDIRSFSTYEPSRIEPMANRHGHYVQVGLKDGKVVWMAGFAAVIPGDPPTAFYTGRLQRVEGGRAYFEGGTVLRLADGLAAPAPGSAVQAKIDVRAHRVIAFVGG